MNRSRSLRTTISTLALVAMLSGCAAGQQNRESIFGSKVDRENIGLAMRAQAELEKQNYSAAVELAERAVENTPNDAGFRTLLGNSYFASGRFASAEAAYRDSLTLIQHQPPVVLKLALVQIAQGKNSQALALLEAARAMLGASDYGLAVALAGRPDAAVAVLNDAARMSDADGQVRQNLALAYGLSGDWTMARVVASQDVPPEQLDARIQQWMAMATPSSPSDQIAALTGVTPSADPGQPQRLALRTAPAGEAYAALAQPDAQAPAQPEFQPVAEPQPAVAEIPAVPPIAYAEPQPVEIMAVAPIAHAEPQVTVETEDLVAEAVQELIQPVQAPPAAAPQPEQADVVEAPVVPAAVKAELPTRFDSAPKPASYVAISDEVRKSAAQKRRAPAGRSNSVVQLGAYSSPDRVSVAWDRLTKRYPSLAEYTPMRARFQGPKGTVWRLSIKGFASQQEAQQRCEVLQERGASCFVRTFAGDTPVQLASR
ncbi:MAG TPA: SPOR domain-containing protein [Sphingomicrobium sp.]|nr:SPOR domain-containing protein [Sphingomicrobium sp.]